MALTRRQRLRRVGTVCCHTLRNLAYYRAWFEMEKPRANEQFWISVNGNFADVTVLEWCKVLADDKGKHHWTKVVRDERAFMIGLLARLGTDEVTWSAYVKAMRFLRDKFIAHLDDELLMTLPQLDVAKVSVVYLYTYLLENEDERDVFVDAPQNAVEWFDRFSDEARAIYHA
ncbi:hypothetical protein FSO04_30775 [Paraburkholderia madseniana]|uniref:HEPN AbiU2-like domain-containing protein n=1 Tax=Paraburkholderia madseniana TaxID=2599607 RepID=A0A6N6W965_9BURK|nr:hypothetical protein [Paraburkholderia madseniana]KAE8756090.1 hypothetical protein FSO04_30775 [Paraburkholderia madseniana]